MTIICLAGNTYKYLFYAPFFDLFINSSFFFHVILTDFIRYDEIFNSGLKAKQNLIKHQTKLCR